MIGRPRQANEHRFEDARFAYYVYTSAFENKVPIWNAWLIILLQFNDTLSFLEVD
jgi:hypothetical protein